MWELYEIAHAVGVLVLVLALLIAGRFMYGLGVGYDLQEQLTDKDNPAVGVAFTGYLAGLVIALAGLVSTPGAEIEGWGAVGIDLGELVIYGGLTLVLLRLSAALNDRFILHSFDSRKELIDDRNIGVGAVVAGSYVATGLVLSGAISGQVLPGVLGDHPSMAAGLGHGLLAAVVFFALGQLLLIIYSFLYNQLSPHHPLDAIERDVQLHGRKVGGNFAAGIGLAGHLVAIGVVLWGATSGDFEGWLANGLRFAWMAGIGILSLPLWRLVADHVLLGRGNLSAEIYKDHNPNAALLEGVSLIGFAVALVLVLAPAPMEVSEELSFEAVVIEDVAPVVDEASVELPPE